MSLRMGGFINRKPQHQPLRPPQNVCRDCAVENAASQPAPPSIRLGAFLGVTGQPLIDTLA